MAKVFCNRDQCVNRSNKKSKHKNKQGDHLYNCLLQNIVIVNYCTGDGDDYTNSKVCECLNFEMKIEE